MFFRLKNYVFFISVCECTVNVLKIIMKNIFLYIKALWVIIVGNARGYRLCLDEYN